MSMPDVAEFYEDELQGKTEEEILKVIHGLEDEIKSLEKEMNSPNVLLDKNMYPTRETILSMDRLYLERAEQALREAKSHAN